MKLSPMMEQYLKIKEEYKDCILFFRLGDFYEMFFEDAKIASKELELTLTGRNCGLEERAPMCGVPFHSAESYIARLIEKNYKVAICEQVEDPSQAKGIVTREVTRVITAGTVISASMLKEKENNYLVSIFLSSNGLGLSYCDISTGELKATEVQGLEKIKETLESQLARIQPREVIYGLEGSASLDEDAIKLITFAPVNQLNKSYFSLDDSIVLIKNQLDVTSLSPLDLSGREQAVRSLGGLLTYLRENQRDGLKQLTTLEYYQVGSHMALDRTALLNLEITRTIADSSTKGSLLDLLDKTKTAMGGRRLKEWLKEPLIDIEEIKMRHDSVQELLEDFFLESELEHHLTGIYDFERLAGRIAAGTANGRDVIALKSSLEMLPDIKRLLGEARSLLLTNLGEDIYDLSEVREKIESAMEDNPPITIREGGLIKEGYSKELDELKDSIKDGKAWIAALESEERKRTGIKTLKVGFNKIFGYYIEVTKANANLVPDEYIRKQTLVNNERYITPKLKEVESLVLNAEGKINKLEYELFLELREEIATYIRQLQRTSKAVSQIDVLCSFSKCAKAYNYTKPIVDEAASLEIIEGRHPIVESVMKDGFIANDTRLDSNKSMAIITGPNMAGKSTYMRQVALIVLMAQAGSFVPASKAHIGIADRIFTRIGASDNLAQGQSTFYVEMSELAYILSCATDKSLVILDEIGRGTSTYDGLSIAWATTEYLTAITKCRCLFATHYHELTKLEKHIKNLINLNVDVSEENGQVVFLHKIVPGPANKSYGIHVAKLAGIPNVLLESARSHLYSLEKPKEEQVTLFDVSLELSKHSEEKGEDTLEKDSINSTEINDAEHLGSMALRHKIEVLENQIDMLEQEAEKTQKLKEIKGEIQKIDVMNLKPSSAFEIIERLKEMVGEDL